MKRGVGRGLGLLDAAILGMLGLIAVRIAGAADPRAVVAGYVMLTAMAMLVAVFAAALWLGFRAHDNPGQTF